MNRHQRRELASFKAENTFFGYGTAARRKHRRYLRRRAKHFALMGEPHKVFILRQLARNG